MSLRLANGNYQRVGESADYVVLRRGAIAASGGSVEAERPLLMAENSPNENASARVEHAFLSEILFDAAGAWAKIGSCCKVAR